MENCLLKIDDLDEVLQLYQKIEQEELKTLGPSHSKYLITKHDTIWQIVSIK